MRVMTTEMTWMMMPHHPNSLSSGDQRAAQGRGERALPREQDELWRVVGALLCAADWMYGLNVMFRLNVWVERYVQVECMG